MAERLRRTLKARVRKSVGSIPTDCILGVKRDGKQKNLFISFLLTCVTGLKKIPTRMPLNIGSVSEGLRRQIRNLLGSARASSNLVAVVLRLLLFLFAEKSASSGIRTHALREDQNLSLAP